MPLEIRELIVRATVGSENSNASSGGASSGNGGGDDQEAQLNLIVEKVLEILKEKTER